MIPALLSRFFWDVQAATLDLNRHAPYIIERLLECGDLDAVRWLLATYSPTDIVAVLHSARGLSARSRRYWSLYFDRPEVACTNPSWLPTPPVS
ncbi:MAG: hypothetical protein HY696_11185 [Deltaproteobacteria bacterium]|nr:hypothetical protein [Deltaproteobacteria bacterium]